MAPVPFALTDTGSGDHWTHQSPASDPGIRHTSPESSTPEVMKANIPEHPPRLLTLQPLKDQIHKNMFSFWPEEAVVSFCSEVCSVLQGSLTVYIYELWRELASLSMTFAPRDKPLYWSLPQYNTHHYWRCVLFTSVCLTLNWTVCFPTEVMFAYEKNTEWR